jgi:hypothetical protein
MGTRNPDREPWDCLGYMADNGFEITVHCPGCDRRDRVPVIPLAKHFGYYKNYGAIAHLLKCNRCQRKGMEVGKVKWSEGFSRGWRPGER